MKTEDEVDVVKEKCALKFTVSLRKIVSKKQITVEFLKFVIIEEIWFPKDKNYYPSNQVHIYVLVFEPYILHKR